MYEIKFCPVCGKRMSFSKLEEKVYICKNCNEVVRPNGCGNS